MLTKRSRLTLHGGVIAVVFGFFGVALLSSSHASTPVASVEAEDGSAASNSSMVSDSTASNGGAIKFGNGVVDSSTINHKYMLGFQGWFQCPTDGSTGAAWRHWFGGTPPASPLEDEWPDVSELTSGEKCNTGLTLGDSTPAYLFSDYNATTVLRQFQWMQQNNIDGVMLQRFLSELPISYMLAERNKVTQNVMAGAEATGRTFNIMYDITGTNQSTLVSDIENDWMSLVDNLHVTQSDRYLKEGGKPIVSIWGFGIPGNDSNAADVNALIDFFHNNANVNYQATVIGGVNNDWMTSSLAAALHGFDIISPWTVGRYNSLSGVDTYKTTTQTELAYATAHNQQYLPVIFPGYSFHNQNSGKALNEIPRLGGNFLWRQAYNDLSAGSTMLYGAMFDEVNEGTAMFKVAPTTSTIPNGLTMVPLNSDGYSNLPSDWYLQLDGEISKILQGKSSLVSTIPITP